jgi:hypothetical protein
VVLVRLAHCWPPARLIAAELRILSTWAAVAALIFVAVRVAPVLAAWEEVVGALAATVQAAVEVLGAVRPLAVVVAVARASAEVVVAVQVGVGALAAAVAARAVVGAQAPTSPAAAALPNLAQQPVRAVLSAPPPELVQAQVQLSLLLVVAVAHCD